MTNRKTTIRRASNNPAKQVHHIRITSLDDCDHTDGAVYVAEYIVQEMRNNAISNIATQIRKLNEQADYFLETQIETPITAYTGVKEDQTIPAYTSKAMAYKKFYEQVNYNRPWDHKPLILNSKELVAQSLDKDEVKGQKPGQYHKYKKADYYYDVWSNIHYGFIGLVCGFSEDELRYGAGAAQLKSDYNTFQKKIEDKDLEEKQYEEEKFYKEIKDRILSFDAKQWDNPEDQYAIEIGFVLYNQYQNNKRSLNANNLLKILDQLPYSGNYKFKSPHADNCKEGIWKKPKEQK